METEQKTLNQQVLEKYNTLNSTEHKVAAEYAQADIDIFNGRHTAFLVGDQYVFANAMVHESYGTEVVLYNVVPVDQFKGVHTNG